jgi:hypothetical protein
MRRTKPKQNLNEKAKKKESPRSSSPSPLLDFLSAGSDEVKVGPDGVLLVAGGFEADGLLLPALRVKLLELETVEAAKTLVASFFNFSHHP